MASNRTEFLVVLVTAPDVKTARKLAKVALARKLIACANLVPRIESHYVWQRKVESGTEVLMILKTSRSRVEELKRVVLAGHPYDTPEFVVLPVTRVANKYAAWWRQALAL